MEEANFDVSHFKMASLECEKNIYLLGSSTTTTTTTNLGLLCVTIARMDECVAFRIGRVPNGSFV